MNELIETYRRTGPFLRAMPWLAVAPVAAEFAQHAIEIGIGLYAPGGFAAKGNAPARMAAGAIKVLAILAVVLIGARWWRFGDARAAARLDRGFWQGLGILLLTQAVLLALLLGLAKTLVALIGPQGRIVALVVALAVSLGLTTLLAPWYVALVTGDRAMTLRRGLAGIAPRLPAGLALLLGAYLPGMALHYALGYGARGRAPGLVWTMMAADALLVGLLAALLGSAYYGLYRLAGGQAPVGCSSS